MHIVSIFLLHLSEVQSREEGLKLKLASWWKRLFGAFRSTIQRRRIETGQPLIPKIEYFNFQKYNPEKKDWNCFRQHRRREFPDLSEVQSREEGLKLLRSKKNAWKWVLSEVQSREEGLKRDPPFQWNRPQNSFRSTIQRRRIETKELRLPGYRCDTFQKYNPEKKDWNPSALCEGCLRWELSEVQSREEGLKQWDPPGAIGLGVLSEVQSREEGLKHIRQRRTPRPMAPFRSTIQRRRIETFGNYLVVVRMRLFQKYNPEKKDWNPRNARTRSRWRPTFRSTIQRRRIETNFLNLLADFLHHFQKYNPEKKDWNS